MMMLLSLKMPSSPVFLFPFFATVKRVSIAKYLICHDVFLNLVCFKRVCTCVHVCSVCSFLSPHWSCSVSSYKPLFPSHITHFSQIPLYTIFQSCSAFFSPPTSAGLYAGSNYCQSHVLVDTWMLTVKLLYEFSNCAWWPEMGYKHTFDTIYTHL